MNEYAIIYWKGGAIFPLVGPVGGELITYTTLEEAEKAIMTGLEDYEVRIINIKDAQ